MAETCCPCSTCTRSFSKYEIDRYVRCDCSHFLASHQRFMEPEMDPVGCSFHRCGCNEFILSVKLGEGF